MKSIFIFCIMSFFLISCGDSTTPDNNAFDCDAYWSSVSYPNFCDLEASVFNFDNFVDCGATTNNNTNYPHDDIILLTIANGNATLVQQAYNSRKATVSSLPSFSTIIGIGDDAFIVDTPSEVTVTALKGQHVAEVFVDLVDVGGCMDSSKATDLLKALVAAL